MAVFIWIISIVAYLFIGGVIAGMLTDDWQDDVALIFMITALWPIVLLAVAIAKISEMPVKIGRKITERFERKHDR